METGIGHTRESVPSAWEFSNNLIRIDVDERCSSGTRKFLIQVASSFHGWLLNSVAHLWWGPLSKLHEHGNHVNQKFDTLDRPRRINHSQKLYSSRGDVSLLWRSLNNFSELRSRYLSVPPVRSCSTSKIMFPQWDLFKISFRVNSSCYSIQ